MHTFLAYLLFSTFVAHLSAVLFHTPIVPTGSWTDGSLANPPSKKETDQVMGHRVAGSDLSVIGDKWNLFHQIHS